MKKESIGITIWRIIYPILIFLGVDTILTMFVMYGYMFYEMFQMGLESFANMDSETLVQMTQELTEKIMNFTYANSLYITIARCAIVAPILFMLMRKDIKRDKQYGRYKEYTSYNKAFLLVLPVLGIVSALSFNHVVMMGLEMLQDLINWILRSLPNGEFAIDLFETFNETSGIIYSGNLFVQIVATCIGAPLVEELLFRGLVYKRMRTKFKVLPCMIFSSLIFGAVHGNIVQFVYAFLVGLILAFVYEKFKTLWAPIIFHAGANLLSIILTYILGEEGVGLPLGGYVLVTVAELAVVFLLVLLIDRKVNRQEIEPVEVSETVEEQNA